MPFSIRNATIADLAAITTIYEEAVVNGVASYELDPPSLAEMTKRFEAITGNGYPYTVAQEDDGTILGYAYASAFRTRPAYRWLVEDCIYLAPEARGKGVGKALLEDLVRRCQTLGFRRMVAVIGGASPASIAVHRSCGFEDGGVLKGTGFKHGRWLDTVLMQRSLGEGTESTPELDLYPGTLYPS
ncbi:GNAT family N-acetyltransferase [Rhizobium sp. LjRoot30]|uniref:GNAT family N-acetyltransferase n=1 Tax=Rhizobium sp. LjRoot30 TaxID=3342320 RepID=UPI003ECDE704